MSDLQRELQQQQSTERLYRDNETITLSRIRDLNKDIDSLSTTERESLQKIERESTKMRSVLLKKQDKLQEDLKKIQTTLRDLQSDTLKTSEKIQREYTHKRDSLENKKKREEQQLQTTRASLNNVASSMRRTQDKINSEQIRTNANNQGRQHNLR